MLLEQAVTAEPPGHQRARLLQRLGQVHYHEDSWATAQELLAQALAEAGDNPALCCEIQQGLAFAGHVRGDIPAAAARARAALELAERAADPRLVSESLVLVSLYEFFLGRGIRRDLMERAAALERWAAVVRPARPAPLWSRGLVWASMLQWADQLRAARAGFEGLHRRMLERGDEGSLAFLLSNMSELECWAGDWDLAARYAAQGQRLAALTEQGTMVSANLYAKARRPLAHRACRARLCRPAPRQGQVVSSANPEVFFRWRCCVWLAAGTQIPSHGHAVDRHGQLVERDHDPSAHRLLDRQLVVSAPQMLDERMPADHNPGVSILLRAERRIRARIRSGAVTWRPAFSALQSR
jgi:hypothetical protein